jgi:hypothetical protein
MKKIQKRESDFSPVEGDNSWGFEKMPTLKTSKTEKVLYTIIILFFTWYVFQAISFIGTEKAPVATSTQSVVDYTNLKPLPEVNWNFTPINQR